MKKWSKRELELLRKGEKIPGRSLNAIKNKRYKLGIRSKYRLSDQEIQDISENKILPNRHYNTIRRKLLDLGLRKKRETRFKWSEQQISKLIELHNQGNSAKTISEMGIFPQSENAIQKKICRLGLAKKTIKVEKFSEYTKNKFKKFLLENWQGKTPSDLLEIWNKENNDTPASLRKVIIYLINLKIKISCYEVQKINNLRKKELKIMLENDASSGMLLEKIRKERANLMSERYSEEKDIWTGLPLCQMSDFLEV